jgi:hypothetical protein
MVDPQPVPEQKGILDEGNDAALAEITADLHPASLAAFSEGLTVEETWDLLQHAPIQRQAEVFTFYPPDKQKQLISGAGRDWMGRLAG